MKCVGQAKPCLKPLGRSIYGMFVKQLRGVAKDSCSTKEKRLGRIIFQLKSWLTSVDVSIATVKGLSCLEGLDFIRDCSARFSTILEGATELEIKDFIPYVCCGYFKTVEYIQNSTDASCKAKNIDSKSNLVLKLMRAVMSDVTDLVCLPQHKSVEACVVSMPTMMSKFAKVYEDDIPPRNTSFLFEAMKILDNLEKLDN